MKSFSKNSVRWIKGFFPILGGFALILGLGMANADRTVKTKTPVQDRIEVKQDRPLETPLSRQERKSPEGTGTDLETAEPAWNVYDALEYLMHRKESIQFDSDRYRELVETLARAMEANPDYWEDMAVLISTEEGLDYFSKGVILEAFGRQTDSVGAHKVLLGLIQSPGFPMTMKRTAVSMLALTSEVPAQTVRFLREEATREPGLRDVALDILARIARQCTKHRNGIVRFLGKTLHTDLTERESARAAETLFAIGRSGTDSQRDLVRSLTSHPCPRIRSAALITLTMSKPGTERTRILHALRADENASVRLAALEALKNRPLEAVEEQVVEEIPEDVLQDLRWTAQNDPNRAVRLRTLEFFHQSYEELPSSVRETFSTVAETDSCQNVRDWAKWYLEYGFSS